MATTPPSNTQILLDLYTTIVPRIEGKIDKLASSGVDEATVKGWVNEALVDFFKKATG